MTSDTTAATGPEWAVDRFGLLKDLPEVIPAVGPLPSINDVIKPV